MSLKRFGIIRTALAVFIMVTPTFTARRFLYNFLLKYEIDNTSRVSAFVLLLGNRVRLESSRISSLNIIAVNQVRMAANARIGRFNRIVGADRIEIGESAFILQGNFIGGTWGTPLESGSEHLVLGPRSQLTINAFVDLVDQVIFGEDVVAGGVGSQFWTHGFDHNRKRISGPITIADHVFVGAASIVLPNVTICSNVTVGAGAVVHRAITEPGFYVSSELVRKS